MIGKCVEDQSPFGVVLIRSGMEALGPLADPHSIGCTAQIINVQHLKDGRMNIVAVGQDRIRILSVDSETTPYLVGEVENYPMVKASPEILEATGGRLRTWVERYIRFLVDSGTRKFDVQQLPEDPLKLAYTAAGLLPIPTIQKQELLELQDTEGFIKQLLVIYRRETALARAMTTRGEARLVRGFSPN
jgi:Lon protease-like protein